MPRGAMRGALWLQVDRRVLRRAAALLCLILAFSCIVAAGVTLAAPGPLPEPTRRTLPILLPLVAVSFLVVLGAVARRHRG